MELPQTQLFEDFLAATRVVAEKPPGQSVILSDRPVGYSAETSNLPELYLSFPLMELSLNSVLGVICKRLSQAGCDADRDIAISVLSLIAETRATEDSAVEHANRCFRRTEKARLSQVAVFPWKAPDGYAFELGPVRLVAFDPLPILESSARGQAFYPIDLKSFSGNLSLERMHARTELVRWEECRGFERAVNRWGQHIFTSCLLDSYFQSIYRFHATQLVHTVRDAQVILEAGALTAIDEDELLSSLFTKHIGLFQWSTDSTPRAWALLSDRAKLSANTVPQEVFDGCVDWLHREFDYKPGSSRRTLQKSLQSFARFMQRARRHQSVNRRDEAFLHFVIALDLLLGLQGQSADRISQRAAVLVHLQLGNTLDDQKKRIKKLYDARSKYVHAGRSATSDQLREIDTICVEVLWDLLACSKTGSLEDVDDWLRQIDFVAAAVNAGKPDPLPEYEALGVPPPGTTRQPPNRVSQSSPPSFAWDIDLWRGRSSSET